MTRSKRKHRARRRTLLPRILDFLGALDSRITALEGRGIATAADRAGYGPLLDRVTILERNSGLYAEALKNYLPR